MEKSKLTEKQAIEKAQEIGVATYGDISMFQISVDDTPAHWMISFTNPQSIADGESQHFAVQVDKATGETRIFRGR